MNEHTKTALELIISPHATDHFIENFFGRQHLYVQGSQGKFTTLFSWDMLNDLLSFQRGDLLRIRVVRDNVQVPPEAFTKILPANGRIPAIRILESELNRFLRDGATMIIDGIDEIFKPVRHLTSELERDLRTRVRANLYSAFRTRQGFKVHRDNHDVFVLHVAGRKHWKVFGRSKLDPRDHDESTAPATKPLWEGTLNPGDVLYIPKGSWHVAIPCDEPTVHFSVGLYNATGVDFTSWLGQELKEIEFMQMDVPRMVSQDRRAEYLEKFRHHLSVALMSPGLLDRFLQYDVNRLEPLPSFNLPWTATVGVLPPDPEAIVSFNYLLDMDMQSSSAGLELRYHGKKVILPLRYESLMTFISNHAPVSVTGICEAVKHDLAIDEILRALRTLVDCGFLKVLAPLQPS